MNNTESVIELEDLAISSTNNPPNNQHHQPSISKSSGGDNDQINMDDDEFANSSISDEDPTNNIIANTSLKLYQAWIGNNTLCCKGRIIIGPDRKLFILTLILIFIPAIIYAPIIMPHYILFVSPAAGIVFLVVPLIGFILMMIGLFYTSFTDPGIIPRRKYFDEKPLDESIESRKPEPPQFQKVYLENGKSVELKYCSSCGIYRLPRASHCRRCDNCVEKFDHHCPCK